VSTPLSVQSFVVHSTPTWLCFGVIALRSPARCVADCTCLKATRQTAKASKRTNARTNGIAASVGTPTWARDVRCGISPSDLVKMKMDGSLRLFTTPRPQTCRRHKKINHYVLWWTPRDLLFRELCLIEVMSSQIN